jgi:D-alanyl-D-alanine carboxypeptidase/D-alanyl-D-alanine-endopeptidase (penicillin-binding protein 4)
LRTELLAVGLPLDGLVLLDGSGLSYENRVTPRLLVAALRTASAGFALGPEFLAALPIAGADGTLEERAENASSRVRAKTGLLTRVTALSGFAQRGNGERVVFSLLVNGFRGSAEHAMDAVDGFAEVLAGE